MNRKIITGKIAQQFDTVNKLTAKVVPHFEKDLVLEFRVAVQKLRSFLHLLSSESDNVPVLMIRRRLKSFYGYIGIIRNIQLQLHYFNSILSEQGSFGLEAYLEALQQAMDEWKKLAIAMVTNHEDFDEERNLILEALPAQLSKITIRKFVMRKAEEANNLLILRSAEENNLHDVRKVMKDILYNWPYINQEAPDFLPRGMNTYENVNVLTNLLSLYGEKCAALDFLQPGYTDKVQHEAGKKFLHALIHQLEKRKDELRIEFYDSLLRFRGVVTTSHSVSNP